MAIGSRSVLDYYRMGKRVLFKGMPFRAVVRLESEPKDTLTSTREEWPHALITVSHEQGGLEWEPNLTIEPSKIDEERGQFFFEFPTDEIPDGEYEFHIEIRNGIEIEVIEDPEGFVLLDRDTYGQMISVDADERFLPSVPIVGAEAVERFVYKLIESFAGDLFEQDQPIFVIWPPKYADSMRPFAGSPIYWTTQTFLEEFRNLALFGVERVNWSVNITDEVFGLSAIATLTEPISARVESYLHDPEWGPASRFKLAKSDLQITDLEFKGFSRELLMSVEHRIDHFDTLPPNDIETRGPKPESTA